MGVILTSKDLEVPLVFSVEFMHALTPRDGFSSDSNRKAGIARIPNLMLFVLLYRHLLIIIIIIIITSLLDSLLPLHYHSLDTHATLNQGCRFGPFHQAAKPWWKHVETNIFSSIGFHFLPSVADSFRRCFSGTNLQSRFHQPRFL